MNTTEVQLVITTLRNYYGNQPQPDWADATVRQVWFDELRPFSLADGMTAVHAIRDRSQALLDSGKQAWFPTLIEFTNDLRWTAVNNERESARDEARVATIHCDGSRFIANVEGPHGARPFRGGDGVVPCPTCNPSLFQRWQAGDTHKRVDHARSDKNLPPCPARPDDESACEEMRPWVELNKAQRNAVIAADAQHGGCRHRVGATLEDFAEHRRRMAANQQGASPLLGHSTKELL